MARRKEAGAILTRVKLLLIWTMDSSWIRGSQMQQEWWQSTGLWQTTWMLLLALSSFTPKVKIITNSYCTYVWYIVGRLSWCQILSPLKNFFVPKWNSNFMKFSPHFYQDPLQSVAKKEFFWNVLHNQNNRSKRNFLAIQNGFFSFTGSATRQAERAGEAAGVSALKTEKQNGP